MTFKALLYKSYAHRRPIGAESKVQRACVTKEFFSPLDNSGPLLAVGSNNKYSKKKLLKKLH